jgi:hypothetical protein
MKFLVLLFIQKIFSMTYHDGMFVEEPYYDETFNIFKC